MRKAAISRRQEHFMKTSVDASRLVDRVAALVEAAKKAGADAADAVAVRGRSSSVSVRLGKVEATESSESDDISLRVFVGKQGRQRLGDGSLRHRDARRTRGRDGQGVARRSLPGSRRSVADRQDDPRPRPVRRYRDCRRAAEAGRACGGRRRACGERRHQFGRQRRQRRAGRAGARHLARLPRPVSRLALLALGKRDRRRGHCDGARLRFFLAAAFRRSRQARRNRPQGGRARGPPPQRAPGADGTGDA